MLPESGEELYVDGNRKTAFSYNRYSGALSYATATRPGPPKRAGTRRG